MSHLFTSVRLGFRTWRPQDFELMLAINQDIEVMNHFPSLQDRKATRQFMDRMNLQCKNKGYCYFAVDLISTNQFIGFIGLSEQTFEADFTPCVDVGWRFAKPFWNNGYATEGAKRCLQFGFENIGLNEVYSMAPLTNVNSINVMKKIGMKVAFEFDHPKLLENEKLKRCVLYEATPLAALFIPLKS
jgi:RimJ/RimL family protein N-acetyltransferase